MRGKKVKTVKGYTEILESESTLTPSLVDNAFLMQFPNAFCYVKKQLDVAYAGLVVCAPFENFHV